MRRCTIALPAPLPPAVSHSPPDRSLSLAIAVAMAAYAMSFFHRFSAGSIADELALSFGIHAAGLGLLASMYFYVYTFLQIPTGIAVDSIGPRVVIFAGGLAAALGALIFAMAPSFGWAIVGRILIGAGVAVNFIALLKLFALYQPPARFATMVGISLVVGNLGSVLAGSPLVWLSNALGWRGAMLLAAAISLIGGVATYRCLPAEKQRHRPSLGRLRHDLAQVLGCPGTWSAFWINVGLAGGFLAFGGIWGSRFLTGAIGMSKAMAAQHISLYFISFALGSLLVGRLCDRSRRRDRLAMSIGLMQVSGWVMCLWFFPDTALWRYLLMVWMGATASGFTITWTMAKEANPPQVSGLATSVANMGGFLAAALLQALIGLVLDRLWNGQRDPVSAARLYQLSDYQLAMSLALATTVGGVLATLWRPKANRHLAAE